MNKFPLTSPILNQALIITLQESTLTLKNGLSQMALTNSRLSSAPREVLLRLFLLRTPTIKLGGPAFHGGHATMMYRARVVAWQPWSKVLPRPAAALCPPHICRSFPFLNSSPVGTSTVLGGPVVGRNMAAPHYHHGLLPYF